MVLGVWLGPKGPASATSIGQVKAGNQTLTDQTNHIHCGNGVQTGTEAQDLTQNFQKERKGREKKMERERKERKRIETTKSLD